MMGLRSIMLMMELMILLTIILAVKATVAAADQAKPGCHSKCGEVTIPYPFGTGGDCNISENFFITCNTTFKPNRAFLTTSNIEVPNISVVDGQLRILVEAVYDCYNSLGRSKNIKYRLQLSKFFINQRRNKFTAIGCDTNALVEGYLGLRYATGCLSLCYNISDVTNGSCSGIGCCQTSIPKGVRSYRTNLESYSNHSYVLRENPCSYAFVVEEDAYNFSVSDLGGYHFQRKEFPIILDWTIGNISCNEARKDTKKFACNENSTCVDSETGSGYLCRCPVGFEGNPFLYGCQDIDECKISSPCDQNADCHNLPGSYKCSCRRGYKGDGNRSNGTATGCISSAKKISFVIVALACSISVGILCVLLGTWSIYKVLKRRKNIKLKKKYFERNGGLLLQQQLSNNGGNVENIRLFTSNELEKATDGYNENRILGQGGQGTVYKGMLTDGSILAIKKYKLVEETIFDEKKLEQFINEVIILSQISHRNVVKLLGCCLEAKVPLLVYEFIPNGTLSQLLHDQNAEFPITWEMRLRIAIEVANALSFLHSAASVPIYHRDIKSSNIMLDDKYRAKVSDFGTSRLVALEQTHLTTHVQGTFGYLDPEYFRSSQFTKKSDVYSFGVVLAEILTGRKPISSRQSEEVRGLVTLFLHSIKENSLVDILDPMVLNGGQHEEIVAIAKPAKRCLNLNGKKRPTMKQVVMELEWIGASENAPQQIIDEDSDMDDMIKPSDIASCSMSRSIVDDSVTLSLDKVSLLANSSTS